MLPAFCSLLYQFLVFPFLLAPVFLSPDSHLSLCFPPYPSPSPMCVHAKLLQSHPTCCDPRDCSPPGFSVHGILRQEYWSELPRPPPGDLPNPGMEPASLMSPTIVGWFFTTSACEAPLPTIPHAQFYIAWFFQQIFIMFFLIPVSMIRHSLEVTGVILFFLWSLKMPMMTFSPNVTGIFTFFFFFSLDCCTLPLTAHLSPALSTPIYQITLLRSERTFQMLNLTVSLLESPITPDKIYIPRSCVIYQLHSRSCIPCPLLTAGNFLISSYTCGTYLMLISVGIVSGWMNEWMNEW